MDRRIRLLLFGRSKRKQVDRTQKLVDAGSLPLSSLLDLRSQKASNELDIINRDNAVNISMLQLKLPKNLESH